MRAIVRAQKALKADPSLATQIGNRLFPPDEAIRVLLVTNMWPTPEWPQFEITYRFRSASYRITVENPQRAEQGLVALWLDDELLGGDTVPLVDDGKVHHVRALIGPE